jgi:hypothetical protein
MAGPLLTAESPRHNPRMLRALACCLAISLLELFPGQQMDSVDLTHPPERTVKFADTLGCKKLSPGIIADGYVPTPDNRPRKLTVEVISAGDAKLALGSTVEAEVLLKNRDTNSIEIPWSTDPYAAMRDQDPSDISWTAATFEFTLANAAGAEIPLVSMTEWLYSSASSPGSQRMLLPGQAVKARVRFKVEDKYPIQPRLREGEWRLSATWEQVSRTVHTEDCRVHNGFYQYNGFYDEEDVSLTVQVTAEVPSKVEP